MSNRNSRSDSRRKGGTRALLLLLLLSVIVCDAHGDSEIMESYNRADEEEKDDSKHDE